MTFSHPLPYNLIVAGIPEVGAKSRVETQVKMYLRLVRARGTPLSNLPYSSLKLPANLLVGERFLPKKASLTGSQLKNALTVEVSVVLNSNPDQRALRCASCTQREWKLWSKKNEKSGRSTPQPGAESDQERIIIFHSPSHVDLINDEVMLRARITCYCRHHEEKTGFRICFQLKNDRDELVAQGLSPPIMITDDHKPSRKLMRLARSRGEEDEEDEEDEEETEDSDDPLPPKKRIATSKRNTAENQEIFQMAISGLLAANELTVQTPPQNAQAATRPVYHTPPGAFAFLPQMSAFSPVSNGSPPGQTPPHLVSDALLLPKFLHANSLSLPLLHHGLTPLGSPLSDPFSMRPFVQPNHDSPSPHSWSSEARRGPELRITKVLPREGRLEGGTEVVVLGSGFYEGLVCYFGNQKATASFCWSSGALLCVLPPSEKGYPETVPIFLGPPPAPWKELACNEMTMFSYVDASPAEKAMNLVADQLSNGAMTGKEMAKDIVGSDDTAIRKFLGYHNKAKSLNNFVN